MSSILGPDGEPIRYCAHPDCNNRATVYPQVVIPPRGYPHKNGVKIVIGLTLCMRHGREETPETFLTDRFKGMAAATVKASRVPLDFDRTIINLRPLGDHEWNSYCATVIEARQGRQVH